MSVSRNLNESFERGNHSQSFVFLPSYLPDELHDQNLVDP